MHTSDILVLFVAVTFVIILLADQAASTLAALFAFVRDKGSSELSPKLEPEYIGKKVKVVKSDSSGITVELNGTPWKAKVADVNFSPVAGSFVIVQEIDNLVLIVGRDL